MAKRISLKKLPVVFISAEGRGLSKRIRAWLKHHYPNESPETVLREIPFYAVEAAVNLSDPDRIAALCTAIDALQIRPALIVIDTLSKNSTDVEESNSLMQRFLNALDATLRQRYGCTVLLIHHVGHEAKDRPRGPSSLVANTEASFKVQRCDTWNISLTTQRLKDSEPSRPLELQALNVDLGTVDDEGKPETSLVLTPTGSLKPVRARPTAKHPLALLEALESASNETGIQEWSTAELNRLAKKVLPDRRRTPEAREGLRKAGWIATRKNKWHLV